MEILLTQVSSQDITQQTLGLEGFISYPQMIPKLVSRNLFRILKKFISSPNVNTTPLALALLSKMLFQDSITQIFSEIIPDLLLLASINPLYSYSLVLSLLSEYLSRQLDFKSLDSVFFVSLSNKENPELRRTCLNLFKDLVNNGQITEELIFIVKKAVTDESDELYNDSINLIQIFEAKKKKIQTSDEYQFAWISEKIIEKIQNSVSWKEKLLGLQSLENILNELDSFSPLHAKLPEFITFLSKVFTDPNFKISISCLKITSILLISTEISKSPSIFSLLPFCILKFGDTKISVRLLTHKILRQFINADLEKTISELLSSLDNNNWHVREESIICLIASMLMRPSDYNYLSLVDCLSKLLDDQRTKIRVASTEALAMIASLCGEKNILNKLEAIVDSEAIKEIEQRFTQNHLPVLTDEYVTFSKEIPKAYRIISSPYLGASLSPDVPKQSLLSSSASFDKVIPSTPTSAETFSSEKKILNKKLVGSKSLRALSSTNFKILHKSNIENEINPIYTPYDELNPILFPAESLQKCIFHSENWLEQFETVNIIRRLTKYNPEVFLSKVTLHNIVLNLVKWADSLRSSLSKNSLIALKEMCDKLGKAADGEISDILRIFLKKTSETNTFISETASQGLDSLCENCTDTKLLINIVGFCENVRNPSIKAKLMHCMTKILQKSKSSVLKMRDINKALQYIHEFLTDANFEVRNSAKKAYELLINTIPDESYLESVLSQGIRESAYRKIKEAIKKKSKIHSEISSPKISLAKKEVNTTLPSLVKSHLKKHISQSARDLILQAPVTEIFDLKKIEQIEADILCMEWKIRYEAISSAFDMIKNYLNFLVNSNKLDNLMIVMQKGLTDSNLKVLIHSLTYTVKLVTVLLKRTEKFLPMILEPLLINLGSANTSIREVSIEACNAVNSHCNKEVLFPLYCTAIGKTSQRGRALIISLIIGLMHGIKDLKLLENFALPISYKYLDDTRIDVKNEASRLLGLLYKTLGNQILESAPTSKLHKIISVISKELE